MQIFYLSNTQMVLLFFILWPVIQVGSALLALYIPDKYYHYDKLPYKIIKLEKNGSIYQSLFKVKKWKHLLPDGAKAWKKKGYEKKHIKNFESSTINKFLIESCRAELTHILPILLVWIFFLFTPFYIGLIMVIYSIITNLPCLIVQRYNRPRLISLLKKIKTSNN